MRPGSAAQPHPDDLAVDRFAEAMRQKMALSRVKGRGGWQTASAEHLTLLLLHHLEKGDPVDIANFSMMLHENGFSLSSETVRVYRNIKKELYSSTEAKE